MNKFSFRDSVVSSLVDGAAMQGIWLPVCSDVMGEGWRVGGSVGMRVGSRVGSCSTEQNRPHPEQNRPRTDTDQNSIETTEQNRP